ncbi:hypothetical protein SAMN05443999_1183 [Roseovarius azorensis]|uniref:Uncharacterized protein n=1 Tax=Roseovarius azorensis TaxID=1287727 RepID=A0A1H7WZT6_9RHOB|nr:hypothetical protein [Roseovarius azorensis]SEM27156.1 hypothetical protein SAMN05443999_1183 [Roseovarius azorensis]
MPERSSSGKERKDGQLVIRIKKAERHEFIDLCDVLDTSAAREIRKFIRDFILSHADPANNIGGPDLTADEQPQRRSAKKVKRSKKK